ncbi:MAG: preprotein translocase subunit SecG, partial [Proteobacteria bacterium]|nr:preprotein translocase subunit SecG [Pseudomonadota bacterium]
MGTIFVIIHVLVCIALILIVLLQTGKGANMGAAFGGGASQTVFGSTGATGFLGKITAAAAIIFMLTSLGLTFMQ